MNNNNPMGLLTNESGASTVIGSILVMFIVVICLTMVGAIVIDGVESKKYPPVVDIEVERVTADGNITLLHAGGDVLTSNDTKIIINNATQENNYSFHNDTLKMAEKVTIHTDIYKPGTQGSTVPGVSPGNGKGNNKKGSGKGNGKVFNSSDKQANELKICVVDIPSKRLVFKDTINR